MTSEKKRKKEAYNLEQKKPIEEYYNYNICCFLLFLPFTLSPQPLLLFLAVNLSRFVLPFQCVHNFDNNKTTTTCFLDNRPLFPSRLYLKKTSGFSFPYTQPTNAHQGRIIFFSNVEKKQTFGLDG